jgi:hypothetical protein
VRARWSIIAFAVHGPDYPAYPAWIRDGRVNLNVRVIEFLRERRETRFNEPGTRSVIREVDPNKDITTISR